MSDHVELKSYLQGTWQAGNGEGETLVDPSNGEKIGSVSIEGLDLGAAVRWGREVGGEALRALTFAERGAILKTLSKAIHEHRDALIDSSMRNNGATRGDAKFDVDGASGTLAAYAYLSKELGDKRFLVEGEGEALLRAARFSGYHLKVPRRGIAIHINAFNFPAWGLAEKLAVSLLAGVPAITKPAPQTALTAVHLVEVLVDTGALPEGALQLLSGAHGDLLDHVGPQDMVAFTGGSDTAKIIRAHKALVENNVRVNVEADSLNAAFLAPDLDLSGDAFSAFLRHIDKEVTQKAGQKCTATRRILVPRDLADDVEAEIKALLEAAKVGDPREDGVRIGPLATAAQLEGARAGLADLVESGAKVVTGGGEHPEGAPVDGYFFKPTLLRFDGSALGKVNDLEVFAPLTSLIVYDDLEEAIAIVGAGGGSLVSTLYTDDKQTVEDVVLAIAPYNGRVVVGSAKVADQMINPGMVLPTCVHGGPGRAGGGEELGGIRALDFYMQRTAIQGDRGVLDRIFGLK